MCRKFQLKHDLVDVEFEDDDVFTKSASRQSQSEVECDIPVKTFLLALEKQQHF